MKKVLKNEAFLAFAVGGLAFASCYFIMLVVGA